MWILIKDKKAYIKFEGKQAIKIPYEEWTHVVETKGNGYINGKKEE